jgi:hypothetical protein
LSTRLTHAAARDAGLDHGIGIHLALVSAGHAAKYTDRARMSLSGDAPMPS